MIVVWLERFATSGKVKTIGYHPTAEEVDDLNQRPHIVVSEAPEMKPGFDMYYNFDVSGFEYIEKEKSEEQALKELVVAVESENEQLAARLRSAEQAASENSTTAQEILELLIDMGVI